MLYVALHVRYIVFENLKSIGMPYVFLLFSTSKNGPCGGPFGLVGGHVGLVGCHVV